MLRLPAAIYPGWRLPLETARQVKHALFCVAGINKPCDCPHFLSTKRELAVIKTRYEASRKSAKVLLAAAAAQLLQKMIFIKLKFQRERSGVLSDVSGRQQSSKISAKL